MIELLSRDEKRALLREMVKDFERQHFQAVVEQTMNRANPTSDQKALARRVKVLAAGLELVKTRFVDLLAEPEPSVEDDAVVLADQIEAALDGGAER